MCLYKHIKGPVAQSVRAVDYELDRNVSPQAYTL